MPKKFIYVNLNLLSYILNTNSNNTFLKFGNFGIQTQYAYYNNNYIKVAKSKRKIMTYTYKLHNYNIA